MEYMRRIQTLGAARLYGWILENGEVEILTSVPEMLYKTGIASSDTLLYARRELSELGVLTCERKSKKTFIIRLTTALSPLNHSQVHIQQAESESLFERCLLVDGMAEDGSPQDIHSNYNKKRKKQISLIKEIFNQNFPSCEKFPLYDGSAKDLLRVQPRCEEILTAVEVVVSQAEQAGKPINSPLAYVRATLSKRILNGETTTYTGEDFSPEQLEIRKNIAQMDEVGFVNPWDKYAVEDGVYA